jgi:hypothetical protein
MTNNLLYFGPRFIQGVQQNMLVSEENGGTEIGVYKLSANRLLGTNWLCLSVEG